MVQVIDAVFDGKVFRPHDTPPIEPNTLVRITVETVESGTGEPWSSLDTAVSLKLEGPPDWAARIHDYLYGGAELPIAGRSRGCNNRVE